MVQFGEHHIIPELNTYCSKYLKNARKFKRWKDVTGYVGDLNNMKISKELREQKERIYKLIRIIAKNNGISSQVWDVLTKVYQNRNDNCHVNVNIADATSMIEYADDIPDELERRGARLLFQKIIDSIPDTRRSQR
jgi:hypothetical protein